MYGLYQDSVEKATEILLVDSPVAEQFARVFVQLRRAGRPIPTNDIWLAATALARDLTMVTDDAHFSAVSGLRVENWAMG